MKFKIESNSLTKMIFSIDIEPNKTIRDLKTKIWLLKNIPFTYQELYYNGVRLVNHNTLEDYHILMDSKIIMTIKVSKH